MDLLEDEIELRQAQETTNIYSDINRHYDLRFSYFK
jgi:hypothetical protein